VAGGCGHAEELEELFEVLFELVEDLRNSERCSARPWPADAVTQRSSRSPER